LSQTISRLLLHLVDPIDRRAPCRSESGDPRTNAASCLEILDGRRAFGAAQDAVSVPTAVVGPRPPGRSECFAACVRLRYPCRHRHGRI